MVITSVSSPVAVMLLRVVRIEEVGFTAKRATTSCPVEMPPSMPPALALAEEGAELVALIKPQFEAGREALGKGGIVSDPQEHERVCREIVDFLALQGWRVLGVTGSPVEGGDGNREFLVGARKG